MNVWEKEGNKKLKEIRKEENENWNEQRQKTKLIYEEKEENEEVKNEEDNKERRRNWIMKVSYK